MKSKFLSLLYPLILLFLILIVWQYLSSSSLIQSWILPSPMKVVSVFFEDMPLILLHSRYTIIATLIGYTLSIILGMATGYLMDTSLVFKKAIYPYLVVSQTIPIIAIAPLMIIWFGYGINAKIFTVVLVCFFPIALNFWNGLQTVSIDHVRLLKSMGADSISVFRYLKFPASLPSLFTGLKLAATYSVMGAIIGEWLGGEAGLGIFMTRATKSYLTHYVFAIILVVIFLSMVLFLLVNLVERKLFKWKTTYEDEYHDPDGTR